MFVEFYGDEKGAKIRKIIKETSFCTRIIYKKKMEP